MLREKPGASPHRRSEGKTVQIHPDILFFAFLFSFLFQSHTFSALTQRFGINPIFAVGHLSVRSIVTDQDVGCEWKDFNSCKEFPD